jgi:hypothetical protein
MTVAEETEKGERLDQPSYSQGIFIVDDQTNYVFDY